MKSSQAVSKRRSFPPSPMSNGSHNSFSFDGDLRLINACDLITKVAIVSAFTITAVQVMCYWKEADEFRMLSYPHRRASIKRHASSHNLLFYNQPPRTNGAAIHAALADAANAAGRRAAPCFKARQWNELIVKSTLHGVDYYGCSTRLHKERLIEVERIRRGQVTFLTSTRAPKEMIILEYLERNARRSLRGVTNPDDVKREVSAFQAFLKSYPVGSLLSFHGVQEPLHSCPYGKSHVREMRFVASRYEAVIDSRKPEESAEMVEIVSGLKPKFSARDTELRYLRSIISQPLLNAFLQLNTSDVDCGNELVHTVLMQQFNIIKDRLLQNRCFDELTGSFSLCDMTDLTKSEVVEREHQETLRKRTRI